MSKVPREEISYEKIYQNLDLEEKHKIVEKDEETEIFTEKIDLEIKTTNLDEREFDPNDVLYCLDDYDLEFITKIKKDLGIEIEADALEFVFDRLEKEWQKILQKKINEKFTKIEPEAICDICTSTETEENMIIVCQGCGISVHRDCYGSSYDKDEVFICLTCTYHNKNPTCMFCPSKDGMMKMTTDCRWGHLTCVLFDETLDFDNPNSKEPIDISKYKRNDGVCIFCKDDYGTKIHCSYGVCHISYHVSCALSRTYFDMANLISYCNEHNPLRSKSIFSNNQNLSRDIVGYRKLNFPPSIRKQMSLSKRQNTIIMDVFNTKAFVSVEIFNELLNSPLLKGKKDVLEIICSLWLHRKAQDKAFLLPSLRLSYDIFQ